MSAIGIVVMTRSGIVEHLLGGAPVVLGRDPSCTIPLEDTRVSRKHLELRLEGETAVAVDLGSRNGSRVDGKALVPHQPTRLSLESVLALGAAVVLFERRSDEGVTAWVHDRSVFDERIATTLVDAAQKATDVAIIEVCAPVVVDAGGGTEPDQEHLHRSYQIHRAVARACDARHFASTLPDGRVWIVEPGSSREAAHRLGGRVEAHLANHEISSEVRVILFPDDAKSLAEIRDRIAGTRGSLRRGSSSPPTIGELDRMIDRVARTSITALILGETGVGKEVAARRLHETSTRARSPLVSINCAALSESLLESELFGHERGAFTGAVQEKMGLLESAAGGTVFFDEIGEMPLPLQAKLLRVLEQREVVRVGGLRPRPIDVRFVFATHRDLEREVSAGRFREDLWFRINVVILHVPPLRDRGSEIVPLALAFLERAATESGRTVPSLSPQARALLLRHSWPGNVRELRNVIERAVILCDGNVIAPLHLPPALLGGATSWTEAVDEPTDASHEASSAAPAPMENVVSAEPARPELDPEVRAVVDALESCAGNQTRAARLLGISRRTLVKRLTAYKLPRPRR
ncbi:hypothetical protein BH09MYX1_BH09MYX1_03220 [soil metagenome]